MLARRHRLTRGSDYRLVVRRGIRCGAPHTITSVLFTGEEHAPRFGFIVSKQVGSAVTRNTVRRRLKAISADLLSRLPDGADVVIRALPSITSAPFAELAMQIQGSVDRAVNKRASAR